MEFDELMDQIASLTPERRADLRDLVERLECTPAEKTFDHRLLLRRESTDALRQKSNFEIGSIQIRKIFRKRNHRNGANANVRRTR